MFLCWNQLPVCLLLVTVTASMVLQQESAAVNANPQSAHLMAERAYDSGERVNGRALNGIEGKVMDNVEARLMGALELLQTYREAAPIVPKFTEKRKNKFEFIRFGRKRR